MMLWAARFAALRPWGPSRVEICVDVEPLPRVGVDRVEDSLERARVLRCFLVRVGMYVLGLISGL